MNALFAQMPTLNFTAIGMACVAVAALSVLANQLFKFKRNAVGLPTASELKLQLDALSARIGKEESETLEAERRRKALYEHIDKLRSDVKGDLKGMMDRMDPVIMNTAEMKGAMHAFTQSFDNFTKIITSIAESKGNS
jgi:hypothetical protein